MSQPSTVSEPAAHFALTPRTMKWAPAMRGLIWLAALIPAMGCLPALIVRPIANKPPPPVPWHTFATIPVVFGGIAWLVLSYRLRIDDQGVSRRVLGFWFTWPWQAFRSGAVDWDDRGVFHWKHAPWSNWRRLNLYCLSEPDYEVALQAILSNWRRPVSDPPPAQVTIQSGKGLRTRITFSNQGIHIEPPHANDERFAWNTVRRLRITRSSVLDKGFIRLEIHLPNRRVALRWIRRGDRAPAPNWRNEKRHSSPETHLLLALCAGHIPASKVVERSGRGRPRTRAEWRYRLAQNRLAARELRRAAPFVRAVPVMCFVFVAVMLLSAIVARGGLAGVWPVLQNSWLQIASLVLAGTAVLSVPLRVLIVPARLIGRHLLNSEHRLLLTWATESGWL